MSKTSGADPITREQVERAIEAHDRDQGGIADALGGWHWEEQAPDYVREGWRGTTRDGFRAALTRWRDELAAAEPVRRVARWDAESQRYALTPPYESREYDFPMSVAHVAGEQQARAWGYEIEGGPGPVAHHAASERVVERLRAMTPADGLAALVEAGIVTPDGELTEAYSARPEPAEDSPERLRERREALGWHRARTADGLPLLWHDIERLETGRTDDDADDRAIYAAALSAEEARRAAKARAEPERPAPRFKVGDWVRVCGTYATHRGTAYQIVEIVEGWHRSKAGSGECSYAETELEPASPPAPEVVDVPQPIVKRLRSAEAQWCRGETVMRIEVDESGYVYAPLALLRAMLEAIDAQQGGAS